MPAPAAGAGIGSGETLGLDVCSETIEYGTSWRDVAAPRAGSPPTRSCWRRRPSRRYVLAPAAARVDRTEVPVEHVRACSARPDCWRPRHRLPTAVAGAAASHRASRARDSSPARAGRPGSSRRSTELAGPDAARHRQRRAAGPMAAPVGVGDDVGRDRAGAAAPAGPTGGGRAAGRRRLGGQRRPAVADLVGAGRGGDDRVPGRRRRGVRPRPRPRPSPASPRARSSRWPPCRLRGRSRCGSRRSS